MPWRCVVAVLALSLTGQSAAAVRVTAGMVIDRSVTIRPGTYRLATSDDLTRPAVIIRGDNITVDFNGAVLAGGPGDADPDSYEGVGIFVDGGRNVTVKNANIRGYKIAIRARQSPDLQLTNNVWMDETKILDEWTPHESKVSRVPIRGGHRRFKVEYYEIGGFAELRFDIQRK